MAIETIKLGGFVDEEVAKINSNFAQCVTELPEVPSNVSDLTNDAGYQTATQVQSTVNNAVAGVAVPTKTSDLTNDSGFITSTAIVNKVDKEAGKGLSTNDYTTADKQKVAKLGKIDISTSAFTLNSSDGKYYATVAGAGKYPVKVFRKSGSEYEEVLAHVKISGDNIIVVSAESFEGYVVTI